MDHFQQYLKKKKEDDHFRTLREVIANEGPLVCFNDRKLVNFASNNYLGLAQHPHLVKKVHEYVDAYGVGSGASRLVCGNYLFHTEVEKRLAALSGCEAVLLFNSGFQANCTVLPTLLSSDAIVFADKFNHNSLLQGCLLSSAKIVRYPHQDLNFLERQLHKYNPNARKMIVTESIFSMDGDVTDLDRLTELAAQHNCMLYVDDSHATGVAGKNGMGLTAGRKGLTVSLGGFGKGCGAFGAYIACTHDLREYFIQACPGIIYSTALPPPALGAIAGSLDLIPAMTAERERLRAHAIYLKTELQNMGCDVGSTESHIIPLIVKKEKTALDLAKWLETKGLFTIPIRPPSVPKGTSRLRLSLSTLHTKDQLKHLYDSIHAYYSA